MAIYSAVPPPPASVAPNANAAQSQQPAQSAAAGASAGQIDIEAWTISALQSLSVSPQGTGAPLSIPLDEPKVTKASVTVHDPRKKGGAVTPPPRPLSRRDSQHHREALLKGKEGSRQRRRWENGKSLPLPLLSASCTIKDDD